ncbi:MAG: hypothetical protein QM679_08245 [Patulibacter sp.]
MTYSIYSDGHLVGWYGDDAETAKRDMAEMGQEAPEAAHTLTLLAVDGQGQPVCGYIYEDGNLVAKRLASSPIAA